MHNKELQFGLMHFLCFYKMNLYSFFQQVLNTTQVTTTNVKKLGQSKLVCIVIHTEIRQQKLSFIFAFQYNNFRGRYNVNGMIYYFELIFIISELIMLLFWT